MFITSSTGDGDLPMMGEDFWAALENADISLKNLKYSVCALGNRNYFSFCGAGKKIDGSFKHKLKGRFVATKNPRSKRTL